MKNSPHCSHLTSQAKQHDFPRTLVRLRGDDERGRGDEERGRGDDERGRGDDESEKTETS